MVRSISRVFSGSGPKAKQSPRQTIWSTPFLSSIIARALVRDARLEWISVIMAKVFDFIVPKYTFFLF
jgi:hypothetical protein